MSSPSVARQAWRNLGAFRDAYGWLLRDLVAFSRRRVLGVVGLSLAGVALQWTVLGAVLLFVGELTQEGGAFQVPLLDGLDLPVDSSAGAIVGWGTACLLMVAGAGAATYGAEAMGFRTARRYVAAAGARILMGALADDAPLGRPGSSEAPSRHLHRLLSRDQTLVLRCLLVVQRSLRALFMALVATLVLVFIDPLLAGVVAVVATLFVLPYYLVNRRVVAAAAELEASGARARSSVARLVEHTTGREPTEDTRRALPGLYSEDEAVGHRWNTLGEILLGRHRSTTLLLGMFGVGFVAVVVAFGVFIARGESSWVAALTFLIALNLASGAFIELGSGITSANRFLPAVQEYVAFMRAMPSTASASVAARPQRPAQPLPALRAPAPTLPGSLGELTLEPGARILCVWPRVVDRLNLEDLLRRLTGGSAADARALREAAFFCGDAGALPPVPAGALLDAAGQEAAHELDLAAQVDALPEGRDTVLTADVQRRLPAALRQALGIAEGLGSGRPLLVVAWPSFARLDERVRTHLLDAAGDRAILFLNQRARRRQPEDVLHTVLVGDHGVEGMGDAAWYDAVAGGPKAASHSHAGVAADPEDLEDEDE